MANIKKKKKSVTVSFPRSFF